jgi:hypothetical protein
MSFDPGFFGKTPPRWFLGQVPLGQTLNMDDPNGWGDRVKVRIVGHHPAEGGKLEDKDLDWAVILRPTSHGSLNRMSTGISGGEWVIGIFVNVDLQKPLPVILGVLGRSDPKYEVTFSEAEKKKSSEFKKTLNFYKTVTAEMHRTLGTQQVGKKVEQNINLPIPSKYFRKK